MSLTLKPYPECKDTGLRWLGEIPAHWEVKRLKRVARINPSKAEAREVLDRGDGVAFLPMEKVGSNGEIDAREVLPAASVWNGFTYFRRGDVLLAKITPCFENGKGACLDSLPKPVGFGSTEFIVMRANNGVAPQYLYRITTLTEFLALGADAMTGSAGQQRVPPEFVRDFTSVVPPLIEQNAIVRFLDRADGHVNNLIRAKQRLIELLTEQKQTIIHRAVTRGLDPEVLMKPTGLDWLPEVPERWELRRLKALSSFITSGSRGWADFYSDEGSIFLRIGNLSTTSIDLKLDDLQHVTPPEGAEGERTRVRPDDLLISITALLGAVGIVPEAVRNAYVNQHTALVRLRKNLVKPRWAAYCLHSAIGGNQFRTLTNGGTKEGLTLGDVGSLWLLYPPLDEQDAIVRHLDEASRYVEGAIQRARREIELIREYRTRLISDVVTGKLDVRGVELPEPDEQESELKGLEPVEPKAPSEAGEVPVPGPDLASGSLQGTR